MSFEAKIISEQIDFILDQCAMGDADATLPCLIQRVEHFVKFQVLYCVPLIFTTNENMVSLIRLLRWRSNQGRKVY